jgi:hypothetical protein
LLDKQWNSKVSDFGLAKLLGSESSYVTTRVMGTFGLVKLLLHEIYISILLINNYLHDLGRQIEITSMLYSLTDMWLQNMPALEC